MSIWNNLLCPLLTESIYNLLNDGQGLAQISDMMFT